MTDTNQIRRIADAARERPLNGAECAAIVNATIDMDRLRAAAELAAEMLRERLAES